MDEFSICQIKLDYVIQEINQPPIGSIMNFFNNVAGIVAPIVAGFVFDRTGSFAANFLIAGAILVVGILCYVFLLGRSEQIEAPGGVDHRIAA